MCTTGTRRIPTRRLRCLKDEELSVAAPHRSLPVHVPHHRHRVWRVALHRIQPGDGARLQLGHQLLRRAGHRVVRGVAGAGGAGAQCEREADPGGRGKRVLAGTLPAPVGGEPNGAERGDRCGELWEGGAAVLLQHDRGGQGAGARAADPLFPEHDLHDVCPHLRALHADGGAVATIKSSRRRRGVATVESCLHADGGAVATIKSSRRRRGVVWNECFRWNTWNEHFRHVTWKECRWIQRSGVFSPEWWRGHLLPIAFESGCCVGETIPGFVTKVMLVCSAIHEPHFIFPTKRK